MNSTHKSKNSNGAWAGGWRLLHADAQRPWPHRGVFLLFERGERRTGSGVGSRVVHVGTHALTEGSGSTLWSCLRQHRGNVNPPGGNHRASQLRKIVGEAIMAKKPSWPWIRGVAATRDRRAATGSEGTDKLTIFAPKCGNVVRLSTSKHAPSGRLRQHIGR